MKSIITLSLTCLTIFMSSAIFAGCGDRGGCGNPMIVASSGGCSSNGCPSEDEFNCSTCQCTDPNAGRNPCISTSEACEAFGNIGAR